MIKVLIADDHAIVQRGLIEILNRADDIDVVEAVSDGNSAIRIVRGKKLNVVVLDIALPDQSGLEVLNHIHAIKPELPVLILSIYPEDLYAVRALKSGASGYLTKDSAPDELLSAIRKVATGGKYVSPTLAEQLVQQLSIETDRQLHEKLSDREYQVFLRIAHGIPLTEIADQMSVSPKTVSSYRSRILEKMGVQNNAELIRYAIEKKLID